MEKKELICIGCPLGCSVTVELEGNEILSVAGNTCRRGEDYARKECTNPTRIVTSTVPVDGGEIPQVSVKTASDIPKDKIFACMAELKKIRIKAPVRIGDVVLADAAGTGVDVIATKDVLGR